MAKRRNQRARRKSAKSRKHSPAVNPHSRAHPSPRVFSPVDHNVLLLIEFDVTWEPLEDPATNRLPRRVRDEMSELYGEALHGDPKAVSARLENLYRQYPEVHALGNWLSMAYRRMGREKDPLRIAREQHERDPDYLFARLELAREALETGNPGEVEKWLGLAMFLPSLYPGRKVFHISEVLNFNHLAVQYFLYIGDFKRAQDTLEMTEELEPDHPIVGEMRRLCGPTVLGPLKVLDALRDLAEKGRRTSRRRDKRERSGSTPSTESPRKSASWKRTSSTEEQLELPLAR